MQNTSSHIVRRSIRSLWENLSLNGMVAGVIAAALLLAGAYLQVLINLDRMMGTWDRDVHISAYFYSDVPEDRRFAIKDDLATLQEVENILYISEGEAGAYLVDKVPDVKPILDEFGPEVLLQVPERDLHVGADSADLLPQREDDMAHPDEEGLGFGGQFGHKDGIKNQRKISMKIQSENYRKIDPGASKIQSILEPETRLPSSVFGLVAPGWPKASRGTPKPVPGLPLGCFWCSFGFPLALLGVILGSLWHALGSL